MPISSHRLAFLRPMCAAVALVLASGGVLALRPPQERERPRILVTNDDGIASEGLHVLVRELATLGDVWVSAPLENQSGSSASLECLAGRPLALEERPLEGAVRACALGGKPVDAAWFGLHGLAGERPFDLVVSGINRGANVGDVAHYSGTVGAALAAAQAGVPAIAVSQDHRRSEYATAARITTRFAAGLLERGSRPGTFYSINVPVDGEEGLGSTVVAPMAGMNFRIEGFREERLPDGKQTARAYLRMEPLAPPGSDTEHFLAHRVTVTPLAFDWTDREALEELSSWVGGGR